MSNVGRNAVVAGLVLILAGAVLATARSAAREGPRDKDLHKAGREIPPRGEGSDFRAPIPPPGLVSAPGVVEPRAGELELSPEAPGVVAEVLVKEGDHVARGTLLLRLHDERERAAVAAAEAELEAARAQLAKVRHGPRREEIDDADAQAGAARVRAHQSVREQDRVASLVERGVAAREDLDRAEAQAKFDEASAAALGARHRGLHRGSRREDVALARAQVALAEARLAQARAARDRMTLVAPEGGVVLKVAVDPGEQVGAGAVVTIGDTSVTRVRLEVDERDVARIHMGQRGYVQAEAFGDRRFGGRVVTRGMRMGRKRVRTDEPDERLDTHVLEVVLELDGDPGLVQGLRASGFLETAGEPPSGSDR